MAKKPANEQPATPAGYKKHHAPKEWNRKVILSTKNDISRFIPNLPLTYDELDLEYKTATPISDDKLWKEMNYIVGASQGSETKYLLFKIGGGLVHARPVSKGELRRWGVEIK